MLIPLAAWHVPYEWAAIEAALRPAIERDPDRDSWRVLDQAMSADLDFWQVPGRGWVATQTLRPVFWVIYVGGIGGSLAEKRELMTEIEERAALAGCSVVKFQGRDWRKVLPDYEAKRREDGRWEFRKALQ